MTFFSAPIRLLLCGLAILGLGSSLSAQSLPQALTEQDIQVLNERFLDSVVVVAGDQVITRTDLVQHLRGGDWQEKYKEAAALPAQEQVQAFTNIENDATSDLVEAFLEVRAGQDRGFDPAIVETLVERRFKREQELVGGYQALHRRLKSGNSSPDQFKDRFRRSLYRYSWQGAITGRQIGTTGRKELNRYVRPGEIRGTYRSFLNSPRLNEAAITGFREAQFETLEIAISFEEQGGRENALKRVQSTHGQLVEGSVSFDEIFDYLAQSNPQAREQSTAQWSLGRAALISETAFGGSAFVDFLVQGQEGDVSPPLESQDGVHLFLITKVEPEQPSKPFADLEVQDAIRKHLADKQERVRLGRAHIRLIQESQLNPPELAKYMLFRAQDSMEN
jgi:hypothetical protein